MLLPEPGPGMAHARAPRARLRSLGLAIWVLLATVSPPLLASADDIVTPAPMPVPLEPEPLPEGPENPDGPAFPVSKFVLMYAEPHPDQPPLADLLPVEVELGVAPTGYVNAREEFPAETVVLDGGTTAVRYYHASAIGSIGRQLLPVFQAHHLAGVFVAPHPEDIEVASERDLRMEHDTVLRMVIHVARITEMRTLGAGDRITNEWHVDNQIHRRIRIQSPLQPPGTGIDGTTDLLKRDQLEDYLHKLNRHPGRRVEAALAPSSDGSGVALDYRVVEAKPWFAWFQSSNTGTEQTAEWQQRIGFTHRQLTNHDDILGIEYLNAGIDRVHGLSGAYEAPWFQKRRPSFLRNRRWLPDWMDWLPVEKVPWWGTNHLRWQLHGYWNDIEARNVSGDDDIFTSDWGGGGRLLYNVYQHRALFVDLMAGFKVRNVEVDNETIAATGQEFFMLPEIGFEIERINEYSTLDILADWQHNVGGVNDATIDLLGRQEIDGDYQLLTWNAGIAYFLEPLIFPDEWRDPNSPMTSTLAHELAFGTRGQYAFGDRVIPQAEQIAGGLYSVRGYPNSTATGDDVYIGTLEYRFHLPQALPIREKPVRLPVLGDFRAAPQQVYGRADWDFILRGFLDAGRTERNNPLPGEQNHTLLGIGLGAELRISRYFQARVDWGHALESTGSGSQRVKKGNNEVYFLFNILY